MSTLPAFKLVEAGFSQTQVEALSEFLQTEAARRSDLMGTEHRLDQKINDLDKKIDSVEHRLSKEIAEVKGTQRVHNWMLATVLALLIAVSLRLFLKP